MLSFLKYDSISVLACAIVFLGLLSGALLIIFHGHKEEKEDHGHWNETIITRSFNAKNVLLLVDEVVTY